MRHATRQQARELAELSRALRKAAGAYRRHGDPYMARVAGHRAELAEASARLARRLAAREEKTAY